MLFCYVGLVRRVERRQVSNRFIINSTLIAIPTSQSLFDFTSDWLAMCCLPVHCETWIWARATGNHKSGLFPIYAQPESCQLSFFPRDYRKEMFFIVSYFTIWNWETFEKELVCFNHWHYKTFTAIIGEKSIKLVKFLTIPRFNTEAIRSRRLQQQLTIPSIRSLIKNYDFHDVNCNYEPSTKLVMKINSALITR